MFITFVYSDLHIAISSSDCCLFVSPIEEFQIWTRQRLKDQMALLKPAWVVDAGDNDVDSAASLPASYLPCSTVAPSITVSRKKNTLSITFEATCIV